MFRVFRRILLATIFFLALPLVLLSQDPFHINYGTKDGLPSAEVYDLAIDEQGVLWLTTDRGVCTFDGYDFTTYTTQEGLSNNTNFEIIEDPSGRFWVTAIDGSLDYFENGRFHSFPFNHKIESVVNGRWVTDLLWHEDQIIFSPFKNLSPRYFSINTVTGELSEHSNSLSHLLHSENSFGKNYLQKFGDQFLFYNDSLGFGEGVIAIKSGDFLFTKPKNRVILIKEHGSEHFRLPNEKKVDFIYEDKLGDIWICTLKGLLRYKKGNLDKPPEIYFEDFSVTAIIMDREDNYWISTLEKGIFFIPSFEIQQTIFESFKPNVERIISISELPSYLLFGTSNGQLFTRNKNGRTGSIKLKSFKRQIRKMYTKGNEAFAVENRIVEHEDGSLSTTNSNRSAISNIQMYNGLFLNTHMTGYIISNQTSELYYSNTSTTNPIARKRITTLVEDQNRNILIGTTKGLYLLDPDNYKEVETLSAEIPILDTRFSDIHVTLENNRWLATLEHGLLYQHKDSVFKITKDLGLNSNLINNIELQGDSVIWIGTNKGLNKLSYRMINNFPSIQSIVGFTTADGLLSNFINDLILWNNELWLGLNNGVNHFKPEELKIKNTPPNIFLESVQTIKENKPIPINAALSSEQNDIVFHFKGICFSKPESKTFYRYKLINDQNDTDWYYTNDRSARFTNLSPGEYEFSVTARNNNNTWSVPTEPFSFRILPHYSKTLWFRSLLVSALLLIVFFITRNRNQQLKKDKALQEALYKTKDAQLSALRSQMNPHFVFNSLNAIQNFIFKNEIEKSNYYLSRFSKLMRSSLEFSKLEYISLQEEIDFIQIYMELEQMRFIDKFDFQIEVEDNIEKSIHFIPPLLLQPILENSVKYAFKHCDYKGMITLQIKKQEENNTIQVRIEDNGSGIQERQIMEDVKEKTENPSFGLEIIKGRIALLNNERSSSVADFKYQNLTNPSGVRTTFILPVRLSRIPK